MISRKRSEFEKQSGFSSDCSLTLHVMKGETLSMLLASSNAVFKVRIHRTTFNLDDPVKPETVNGISGRIESESQDK